MNNKTEEFLNTIGIDEDNMIYFENSSIEKVSINKSTNRFHFFFKIEDVLPLKVYNDLKSSIQNSFNHKITITVTYTNNNYEKIEEYLNKIIDDYAQKEIRYGIFKNRKIKQKDNIISFPIYNKIEEINISNIKEEIEKKLKDYGFNIKLELVLKQEDENDLLKKI